MTGIASLRELLNQIGGLAQLGKPEALDKIDTDAVVDEIAEMLGTKPELIFSADEVKKTRDEKIKQMQEQKQSEQMLAMTEGVRNVSGADPQKLSELAQMVAPVAAAQGGMTGQ
jgi:hypothetical protein